MTLGGGGCVERLIGDYDSLGGAEGGRVDTESEGISESARELGGTTAGAGQPCSGPEECGAGQTCFEGTCVGEGTVRISLSWGRTTDLDLHVMLPDGSMLNFETPVTDHGQLDVDDCVSGVCADPDGTHVENVFLNSTAPRGAYEIVVVNFDGRRSTDYAIEVAGEVTASFSGNLPDIESAESPGHFVTW